MQSTFGIVDDGSTAKTIQQAQKFDKVVDDLGKTVEDTTSSLLDMDRAADKTMKSANQAATAGGKVTQGGSGLGGIRQTTGRLGQAGGALSSLGVGGGQELAQLSQAGSAITELGESAGAAKEGVIKLAANLGTKGGVVGVVLAATAIAAAGAIFLLSQDMQKATEAAKITSQTIKNTAEAFAFHDEELAASQQRQLMRDIQIKESQVARDKQEEQSLAASEGAWDDFLGFFKEKPSEVFRDSREGLEDELDQLNSDLDALTGEFGELDQTASSTLNNLIAQEQALIASRQQSLDDLAQDRARAASRQREDEADAAQKLSDQRAEAAQKDAARIAKITQDASANRQKTIEKADAALNKLTIDANKQKQELEKAFIEESIDAQNLYNERRAQADNDFRNEQFDAIQANDIIAALRAKRDAEEQEKQDKLAFDKEAKARDDARRQRLQELKEEQRQRAEEIKSNLKLELKAQQDALDERLKAEAIAADERKKREAKADKEAEKARKKRARRQAEDQAIADERSQRAFEEQLKRIEKEKEAERQALKAFFATIQAGGEATIGAIGQANQAVMDAVVQNAQQGLNQIFGNKSQGSSAPLSMSGGTRSLSTPSGIAGGNGTTPITINVISQDIATGEDVARAIQGAMGQMAQVDIQVLADSLAGVR
jgi:hypothetical protein